MQLEKMNNNIQRARRQIKQQQEKMGSYTALFATKKNAKVQRFGAALVQVRAKVCSPTHAWVLSS